MSGVGSGTGSALDSAKLMLSSLSPSLADRTFAATIFVVEDDPIMSGMLSNALVTSGYRVFTAATGAEARTLCGEVQPDLIILDLMLPDSDGLQLTGSFQTLTSAPIVICSARHGQIDRVLGLKLGAVDFVAKPFELDDLEARIGVALLRSRRRGDTAIDDSAAWRHGHPVKARLGPDRWLVGADDPE